MKTVTLSLAAGAAMVAAGAVSASEPLSLTDAQLDNVSAGFFGLIIGGSSTTQAVAGSTGGCPLGGTTCGGINISGTATSANSDALPAGNTANASTLAGSVWTGQSGTFSTSGSASGASSQWGLRICGQVFGTPC